MVNEYLKKFDVDNDPLFKNFKRKKEGKGLSPNTIKGYRDSLNKLCRSNEEHLSTIVETCKINQRSRIDNETSTLIEFSPNDINSAVYQYMDNFLTYCEENGNTNNTINRGMTFVRTFLDSYDVKLPKWELLDSDTAKWQPLTKGDINFVLNHCNILYISLTTFLASTGMRISDALSLTIGDFMKATAEYHNFNDAEDFIDNAPQDMMGYWSFHPKKTQRHGIVCKTFNSQESSNYILQNLRRIKNEYIPAKNKKNNLNLKLDKNSALFGSRNQYFLKPPNVKSLTRFYEARNKEFHEWKLAQIKENLDKGIIAAEDYEEEVKKIPKVHAHAFRKFFIDTIRNYGNVEVCVVLEGHKELVSTDKSYVKPNKDRAKEVYIKALHALSIEEVEARIITDSQAEELKQEVKSLNKKLEEKDKETQKYKDEIARLKASSTTLTHQIVDIQEQINNINHLNDITRIQDYIADNDLVKEYGLASRIIDLYKEDMKKGVVSVDNSYIDTLITRSYNRSIYDGENEFITKEEPIERDELYNKLEYELYSLHDSIINGTNIKLSDAQDKKISKMLDDYLIKTWKAKGKIDHRYVGKKIDDIVLNG